MENDNSLLVVPLIMAVAVAFAVGFSVGSVIGEDKGEGNFKSKVKCSSVMESDGASVDRCCYIDLNLKKGDK